MSRVPEGGAGSEEDALYGLPYAAESGHHLNQIGRRIAPTMRCVGLFFFLRHGGMSCSRHAGRNRGWTDTKKEKTPMIVRAEHRARRTTALRAAGLGAALALLLAACGEQALEGEQQQGSTNPPAATDQSPTG